MYNNYFTEEIFEMAYEAKVETIAARWKRRYIKGLSIRQRHNLMNECMKSNVEYFDVLDKIGEWII